MKAFSGDCSKGRKTRGVALITALFVLVFLFILGITFRFLTDQHYIFSSDLARRMELYYLAESGVEYAVSQRAYWRDNPHSEQFELKGDLEYPIGQVQIYVQDGGSSFTVISKGIFRTDGDPSLIRNNLVTITATIGSSGDIVSKTVCYD